MIFDLISPAWGIGLLFAVAAFSPLIARLSEGLSATIWAGAMAASFGLLLAGSSPVWEGTIWRSTLSWAPNLGLDWQVWVAPAGLLMGLLVTGIGTLVVIYGCAYFAGSDLRGRFFLCFFLFAGAMLGIALTENLLALFVFWELTSIASYLLIGTYHEKLESRRSALDALLVTGFGGLALLAGILLIGQVMGTYTLGELIERADSLRASPLYPAIFILIALGAFTKSAQIPFHFWLPGAMAAPAPVSAYLHSATMVKAGVFLLAVLHPVLGNTPLWHYTLLTIGALTMTWGALVAVVQTDLKRLLAFTTLSALGTLVMLLGAENLLAAKTVVVFLIVHAFYKGALFMIAGILEKVTGTRDVTQLTGLMKTLPVLGIAAAFAAASMSGLPPFIGFIAKELLYEVKLEEPLIGYGLLICGIVTNAANIVVAIKVGVAPFTGSRSAAPPLKKRPSIALMVGPVVLGVASLALGIFSGPLLGASVEAVASQIKMEPVPVKLKLWHGLNLVLLLSVATVVLGLLGYRFRHLWQRLGNQLHHRFGWSAQLTFRHGLDSLLRGAGGLTRSLQSGDLNHYFFIIIFTTVALLCWGFLQSGYSVDLASITPLRLDATVTLVVIAAAALGIVRARTRMQSILMLGVAGFGVSGLFALYGGADLAITQLLVETLTLVLFSLAIYGLPKLERSGTTALKKRLAAILATAVGIVFALLTLKAMSVEVAESISREITERSLPEGYGRNIVNVILVDFRSLDTLGEICVLLIAALGVAAMLQSYRASTVGVGSPTSSVLSASAKITAPAMVALSVFLLLRGHNEPGGGFIGGLIAAMGIVLLHLAHPDRRLAFLGLSPVAVGCVGLALAALAGLPGLVRRDSFLAALWGPEFQLPLIGKLKLGTPLAFDIGVYLVVAGVVLLLYETMERWNRYRVARSI